MSASRLHWFHWLAVGASLLLTVGAWQLSSRQQSEKARLRFEGETERVVDLVRERLRKYEDALWAGVSLVNTDGVNIPLRMWRIFSGSMNLEARYPGVNGIGIIRRLSPSEVPDYLAHQRREKPDFKIFPSHTESELLPISFVEPAAGNEAAIGLDMAHESNRYTAAKLARDKGTAQITGPITLVQDSGQTPGFLFFAPFYNGVKPEGVEDRRREFRGMVYAPFVVRKLMAGALSRQKRHVDFRLSDGGEMLHDELGSGSEDVDPEPLLKATKSIRAYGRTWNFEIWSSKSFRRAVESNQPVTILAAGLLIDVLLLSLFFALARSNRRAVDYGDNVRSLLDLEAQRLRASNKELESFTYVASHDLQEPLRKLTAFSRLLEEDLGDRLTGRDKEYLGFLSEAAERMRTLVRDLLTHARAGHAEPRREKFGLRECVDVVLRDFEDQIARKGARIVIDDLPAVSADRTMVTQVYQNLIGNGLKFTQADDPQLHLTCELVQGQRVFGVRDNGIGIESKNVEKVFEPFGRLHHQRTYSGSGIGLAVCRKFVIAHGGVIWVDAAPDGGCHFKFTLAPLPSLEQLRVAVEVEVDAEPTPV